jgi:hypothetical protein
MAFVHYFDQVHETGIASLREPLQGCSVVHCLADVAPHLRKSAACISGKYLPRAAEMLAIAIQKHQCIGCICTLEKVEMPHGLQGFIEACANLFSSCSTSLANSNMLEDPQAADRTQRHGAERTILDAAEHFGILVHESMAESETAEQPNWHHQAN